MSGWMQNEDNRLKKEMRRERENSEEKKGIKRRNSVQAKQSRGTVGTSTSGSSAVFLQAFLHLYLPLPREVCSTTHTYKHTRRHTQFIQLPYSQVPFIDRQGQQLLQNLTFSVDAGSRELLACAQQLAPASRLTL